MSPPSLLRRALLCLGLLAWLAVGAAQEQPPPPVEASPTLAAAAPTSLRVTGAPVEEVGKTFLREIKAALAASGHFTVAKEEDATVPLELLVGTAPLPNGIENATIYSLTWTLHAKGQTNPCFLDARLGCVGVNKLSETATQVVLVTRKILEDHRLAEAKTPSTVQAPQK